MFADRIPASISRKRYETVGERCAACTLYGGREEPCESEQRRTERWVKQYGQRCPRVDLAPENRVAAHLAQLLISEELRPLAPAYLETAGPRSNDERERLMMIVSSAMNDKRVGDAREALISRRSERPVDKPGTRIVRPGDTGPTDIKQVLKSVEVIR